jgi:hypothetical protein
VEGNELDAPIPDKLIEPRLERLAISLVVGSKNGIEDLKGAIDRLVCLSRSGRAIQYEIKRQRGIGGKSI